MRFIKDTAKTTGDPSSGSRTAHVRKALFEAVFHHACRETNILRHVSAPAFTPIYMVCRGTRKIRGGCWLTNYGFKASLSRDSRPGLVTGAPRVRAQRPTSRGFLRRQGLDRPPNKGHGQHRATRPRPMTNRVKSAAASSRLKSLTALAHHTWGARQVIRLALKIPCLKPSTASRLWQTIARFAKGYSQRFPHS